MVPTSGSEKTLEVHFLHLIRVDYSVPQPRSRQSPTKGGLLQCAQEHSDPRGAGYLSTPTDQSVPANGFTPSPSTFHSCVCVCVVCVSERADEVNMMIKKKLTREIFFRDSTGCVTNGLQDSSFKIFFNVKQL